MKTDEQNKYIDDRYLCGTCGTMWAYAENGFCENGHDDWIHLNNGREEFSRASKNTGITVEELMKKLKPNVY